MLALCYFRREGARWGHRETPGWQAPPQSNLGLPARSQHSGPRPLTPSEKPALQLPPWGHPGPAGLPQELRKNRLGVFPLSLSSASGLLPAVSPVLVTQLPSAHCPPPPE